MRICTYAKRFSDNGGGPRRDKLRRGARECAQCIFFFCPRAVRDERRWREERWDVRCTHGEFRESMSKTGSPLPM